MSLILKGKNYDLMTKNESINTYISISWCKSKTIDITAAKAPAKSVAFNGVFVRVLTCLKTPKSRPSEDIAYKIRGNGNILPNKFVHRANTAPIDTILSNDKVENY